MDKFIANLNVERFEKQLAEADNEGTRALLRDLLRKEREKLAAIVLRAD